MEKLSSLLNNYPNTKVYYFLPSVEFEEAKVKYKILNRSIKEIKKITFEDINSLLEKLNFSNLMLINQNEYLLQLSNSYCNKLECFDGHDNKNLPLYRDNHHLSSYGANLFINKLFKKLSFD